MTLHHRRSYLVCILGILCTLVFSASASAAMPQAIKLFKQSKKTFKKACVVIPSFDVTTQHSVSSKNDGECDYTEEKYTIYRQDDGTVPDAQHFATIHVIFREYEGTCVKDDIVMVYLDASSLVENPYVNFNQRYLLLFPSLLEWFSTSHPKYDELLEGVEQFLSKYFDES